MSGGRSWLPWLPAAVSLAAIIVLTRLGQTAHYEPHFLMPAVNLVVFAAAALVTAALAARGYLAGAGLSALLLGGGMVAFGLSGLIGSVLVSMRLDLNAGIATHDLGALFAGWMHLIGAARLRFGHDPGRGPGRRPVLAAVYAGVALVCGALAVVAQQGALPPFMTPAGTTALREAVLGGTIAVFTASALMLTVGGLQARSDFLRWYGMGLALTATGLVGVALERVDGSPLSWLGRGIQSVGQIYVLVAVLMMLRGAREAGVAAGRRIGAIFHNLELEHGGLLDAAAEGIWLSDRQGTILYANRQMAEMLGCRQSDLLGLQATDFICAEDLLREQSHYLLERAASGRRETRLRARDGRTVWVSAGTTVIRDGSGRAGALLEIVNDISDRKRFENELREEKGNLEVRVQQRTADLERTARALSADIAERKRVEAALDTERRRFNELLEALPAYLILLTPDHQTVFANRFFRERFGESRGRPCYEFLFGRTEPCEICETFTPLKTGRRHAWEWTGPDGRDYDIYDFPFRDIDGSPLVMEMGIDVTERKRAEAELRRHQEHLNELVRERTAELESRHAQLAAEVTERRRAEEAVREREHRIGAILGSITDCYYALDHEWRVLEMNERAAAYFSRPREAMVGRVLWEVIPEQRGSIFEQNFRRVMEIRAPVHFEAASAVVRGRSAEVHAYPSDHGISVYFRDITRRVQEAAKLRQLNRTLRALTSAGQALAAAPGEAEYLQAICRIVVEDCGHALAWIGLAEQDEARTVRPVACAGHDNGYLATLNITWADEERGRGPTGTAIRTGRPCTCRDMLAEPRFAPWREEACRRGFASSLVLPLRSGGRVLGAISIYSREPDPFSDDEVTLLTELADGMTRGLSTLRLREANARAEEALRRSESEAREQAARLATVLDAAPSVIWIAEDRECRVIRGNRFAHRLLRMPPGANMSKSQAEDDRVAHFRVERDGRTLAPEELPIQRVAATGRELNDFGLDLVFDDGEVRSLVGNVAPIHGPEGEPAGAIGAFIDITERRQMEEELRQLNEQLDSRVRERTARLQALATELTLAEERERRRLAQVLHDHLQQVLAAAKLHLTALAHGVSEAKARPLREIEAMLADAIQSSRSLSVELSPPILYEDGLAGALHWLARSTREKHRLGVTVHADAAANPVSQSVYVLLFQSARELLFNIVKHAGVETATVHLDRVGEATARLTIEDAGRGFDPSAARSEGGSVHGMGLLSIRERLDAVGGSMEIASAPGEGTRIILDAPIALPGERKGAAAVGEAAQEAARAAAADDAAQSAEGKIRILLADDHEVVRQGLARLLQGEPDLIVVGEASNGREAVELARTLTPDVVVLDVRMPEMNGMEATRRIVASQPGVRVIGLSMHEEREMAEQMLAAGAAVYMHKGSPAEAVLEAIRGGRP